MTAPEIIARIEAYCRDNKVAETTFGLRAVNDGKLVSRLRAGSSITLDTLSRIEALLTPPAAAEQRQAVNQ